MIIQKKLEWFYQSDPILKYRLLNLGYIPKYGNHFHWRCLYIETSESLDVKSPIK